MLEGTHFGSSDFKLEMMYEGTKHSEYVWYPGNTLFRMTEGEGFVRTVDD